MLLWRCSRARSAQNRDLRLSALLLFGTPLFTACRGPLSTLDPAGPSAAMAAELWWGMFGFASIVLLAVTALWWHAIRRPGDSRAHDDRFMQKQQNRWITGGGLVLPIAAITVLLLFGIPAGHRMLPLPPDEGEAFRVDVIGHQWWWEVSYPIASTGSDRDLPTLRDEVHIPAGVPVDVYLHSADVIHSFWVPRLAGKLDMIPGHTNVLRIEAARPGVYRGVCAEFCGLAHAHMQFELHAHAPEDFQDWMDNHSAAETNDD